MAAENAASGRPWSYRDGVAPAEVMPTRVVGSNIAHLATATLTAHGAGYRAICPAADAMGPLELVPLEAVVIWCPSCRAWADAVGVELPRSR